MTPILFFVFLFFHFSSLLFQTSTSSSSASRIPAHGNDGLPNGWVWGCSSGNISSSYPFCDPSLLIEERIADLMSRLSLEEKLTFLGADTVNTGVDNCNNMNSGIKRLGIPPYMNLVETNTAIASACIAEHQCATVFASPALLAASFNRSVWRNKGMVFSEEMRAFNNYGWWRGMELGKSKIGLTGFGPNINIIRDPRFGRNSELPSEDPYLTGIYATEMVQGMQMPDGEGSSKYLKMIAGLKHYAAYSVETNRASFIPNITLFDLSDTYLYQYSIAFEKGQPGAAMCSYSGINGIPSCANNFLLNDLIRKRWGQSKLLVVTDCGAINNMVDYNEYASSPDDAAAKTINGGADIDMGDNYFAPVSVGGDGILLSALNNNLTDILTINQSVERVLYARFITGQFDPLEYQPYTKISIDVINSTRHQFINYDSTAQGLVLLKNNKNNNNNNNILPFNPKKSLAVLGPHLYSTRDLMEDYKGDQECYDGTDQCVTTIGQLFKERFNKNNIPIELVQGIDLYSNDDRNISMAIEAAKKCDQIILLLGIGNQIEHEGIDRDFITLPGLQEKFALEILSLNKPTVIVLINGGAVSIDNLIEPAPAIIELFYPSMKGAEVLYDSIFGIINKWGRLPYTIYSSSFEKEQSLLSFDMTTTPGRTYRYYSNKALYSFGYGLSYSSYSINNCNADYNHDQQAYFLSCTIINNGPRDGDVIIMIYHSLSNNIRSLINHPAPIRSLIEFSRLSLSVNQLSPINFLLPLKNSFIVTNNKGDKIVYKGDHHIEIDIGDGTPPIIITVNIDKQFSYSFF